MCSFLFLFYCNVFDAIGGLDLVLLPGVAFTRTGYRLGHGMGHYDKYLKKLFDTNPGRADISAPLKGNLEQKIQDNKTILIGLAFKQQIVDDLPIEEHDFLLDMVLTG